jgi:tryptophan-rich sensory protein
MSSFSNVNAGVIAGVCIAAAAASVAVPFVISRTTQSGKRLNTTGRTASSPPGAVFAVVWAILYALAGVALTLQGFSAKTSADWAAFGVLAATVVATWGWPAVYDVSIPGGSWFLVGLLALGLAGVLVLRKPLAALWAPLLAWFVFALVLSAQSAQAQAQAQTPPGPALSPV